MREFREFIRVRHPVGGRVLTKQSEKNACDINLIMRRWIDNGVVRQPDREAFYGDFSNGGSLHEFETRMLSAKREFGRLPAPVRKRCNNDPGLFLDLVMDPEARDELRELGLLQEHLPAIRSDVEPVVGDPEPAPEG